MPGNLKTGSMFQNWCPGRVGNAQDTPLFYISLLACDNKHGVLRFDALPSVIFDTLFCLLTDCFFYFKTSVINNIAMKLVEFFFVCESCYTFTDYLLLTVENRIDCVENDK